MGKTIIPWTATIDPDGTIHPGYTLNLWWGCLEVSEGCANCLHPDTLILKADWSWTALKNINVGDKLIAFNEHGKGLRNYQMSTVEAIWETYKPAVRINTKNTSIIASYDHLFLRGNEQTWAKAKHLNLSSTLRFLPLFNTYQESIDYKCGYISGATLGDGTMRFDPQWTLLHHRDTPQRYWRVAVIDKQEEFLERLSSYICDLSGTKIPIQNFDGGNPSPMIKLETRSTKVLAAIYDIIRERSSLDFKRGWLAGMFDSEGNFSRVIDRRKNNNYRVNPLRISQVNIKVLERIVDYAKEIGFDFVIEFFSGRIADTAKIVGGAPTTAEFFAAVRPALSCKTHNVFGGYAKHAKDQVVSIESLGEMNLIDIQTSTKTYIANGLMTHNCYAKTLSNRFGYDVWGKSIPRRLFPVSHIDQLKSWNHKAIKDGAFRRVFIGSMMDIFEDNDSMEMKYLRSNLLSSLSEYKNLSFLLLTKRIENAKRMVPEYWINDNFRFWPDNVRVGCTIENNKRFDERIGYLTELPHNFISFEPLLEEITPDRIEEACKSGVNWLIVGGESGTKARPFNPLWLPNFIAYGEVYNVPVFVKQMGTDWAKKTGAKSSKGEDMSEWAELFRVRQFPIEPRELTPSEKAKTLVEILK